MMLRTEHLSKHFNGLIAVDDVSIAVKAHEILGVIGANGAGKSTLLNVISGFTPATSGKVFFEDRDITRAPAEYIVQLGCGRNFQSSLLFMNKTVTQNVFMAQHLNYRTPLWKRLLRTPAALREERALMKNSGDLVRDMGLDSVKGELARSLPHGYQRVLSVCLALASKPKLLLLDEPLTGMNQTEIFEMCDLIRALRDGGLTLIMIEHNVEAVMRLCDRLVVLDHGKKIADGLPEDVRRDSHVIESYLGKG